MIDIFDMIHYLIGFIVLVCLLWLLVKCNNYMSKDNIIIMPTNMNSSF
jgi:hypothetical protein